MKQMRSALLLLFFLISIQGFTQKKAIVDSLNKLYSKTTQDTLKINYLIEIAYEYRYAKPDTSLLILKKARTVADRKSTRLNSSH